MCILILQAVFFEFQTVKYVKILLAKQPELSEYLVSIIPKPEDVQNQARNQQRDNVPFSSAGELLRHSLHIIGSNGKGYDLKVPGKVNGRYSF